MDNSRTLPRDDDQLREEARRYLQDMREDELGQEVVRPLFLEQGWQVEPVCRDIEREHRCDLLIWTLLADELIAHGVQLKTEPIGPREYIEDRIEVAATRALSYTYVDGRGRKARLSKFYWITSAALPRGRGESRKTTIAKVLNRPGSEIAGRVEVWDVERLIDEVVQAAPKLLKPLQELVLRLRRRQHAGRGEGVFAAHLAYRLGLLRLTANPVDLKGARAYLQSAEKLAKEDECARLFYPRVAAAFYETWREVLDLGVELPLHRDRTPECVFDIAGMKEFLAKHFPSDRGRLLFDVQLTLEQLNALRRPLRLLPGYLSPLNICRSLLRAGFPPSDSEIEHRLQLVEREMDETKHPSVDGRCSKCTGVAVSCLGLARRFDRAHESLNWLRTLGPCRYGCIDAPYLSRGVNHCSLSFAAAVLQGDLDVENCVGETAGRILSIMTSDEAQDDRGLWEHWIRHRERDALRVCADVYSAVLRCLLCGHQVTDQQRTYFLTGVKAITHELERECGETTNLAQLDITRYNIATMCVDGLLSGTSVRLLEQVMENVRVALTNACQTPVLGAPFRPVLPNPEDAARLVEGVFQYWETRLMLEETQRA